MFYEALKHLMWCLIFKYLLCLLRDKDANSHSGLQGQGQQDVRTRARHSPEWQAVVLQGWESWGA